MARQFAPGGKVLDLGCGRGEWLELAQSYGFAAHGVDLDEGMLADCFARGLSVTHGDAIEYLAGEADGSLAIVSGFHIAEHLPFEVLQRLYREAQRALRPGGFLILETPNAENLHVGSLTFHMDPTHNKPLPPGLLSFLARHYGFARAEILRLQESAQLRAADTVGLLDVFTGVSPDYGLVAQTEGTADEMAMANAAFNIDRGLTLDTLSARFENAITRRAADMLHERIDGQLADLRRRQQEQERHLEEQLARIEAIYNSTSWRITKPVRALGLAAKRGKNLARRALRAIAQVGLAIPGGLWLARKLKQRLPGVFARMQRLIYGQIADGPAPGLAFRQALDRQLLSPRAADLYVRLTKQLPPPRP